MKETFCSMCYYFGNNRKEEGKQNKCNKFHKVCIAVNNGGNCHYFKSAKRK